MDKVAFVEQLKNKTKKFAIDVIKFCNGINSSEASRIIIRQLLRSSTSVGANYRAACRARSKAEFYSKISIVIEEADECAFWLEILKDSDQFEIDITELERLHDEIVEVIKILAKARENTK